MADTITYTVTTVNGSRQHTVSGMLGNRVAAKLLTDAFAGANPGFFLPNPATFYTLSNVISVSIEGGLHEIVDDIQRKMGFDKAEGD